MVAQKVSTSHCSTSKDSISTTNKEWKMSKKRIVSTTLRGLQKCCGTRKEWWNTNFAYPIKLVLEYEGEDHHLILLNPLLENDDFFFCQNFNRFLFKTIHTKRSPNSFRLSRRLQWRCSLCNHRSAGRPERSQHAWSTHTTNEQGSLQSTRTSICSLFVKRTGAYRTETWFLKGSRWFCTSGEFLKEE